MKITCLVNNYSINSSFHDEEALSLFVETEKFNILFDTGIDDALFLNADLLDIKLNTLDYIILSHGHKDHTGALKRLMEINKKAKIIAHKEIFSDTFTFDNNEHIYIGIDKNEIDFQRFIFVEDLFVLDNNTKIYGNLKSYEDSSLETHFVKRDNNFFPYLSEDEIYLHIDNLLISGCSHRGILNIINGLREKSYLQDKIWLMGGLHLEGKSKDELLEVNDKLKELGIKKSFINHCTLKEPNVEGNLDNFEYFYAGDTLILE